MAPSSYGAATPHRPATDAAAAAFAAGGNAVDAALAAAAVLTVTYPHNCALGGDLFALVRAPDGRTVSVNASGPAGARADRRAQRAAGPAMPVTGAKTVTVPGLVAGWGEIHARGARRPWAAALEPAIAYAADGVEVAPRLAAGLAAAGSDVTAEDLAGFAPETGEALRGGFGALDVLTSPPNSSGVLVLQALAALEAAGLDDPLGADAGTLAEILRLGDHDRTRLLGDPAEAPFDRDAWLGEARIEDLVADAHRAAAGHRLPASVWANAAPRGDTAAIVTWDADGWAVSLIQSLLHFFGAQVLEPSTGVLLHNRGASFALDEGHPNALAPGRRPAHTLMPVMVEEDGRLAGVLGTMGGKVHAQIHVQVLLRLLAGQPAQAAVDAPRWVVGGIEIGEPDDMIRIEDGCADTARDALARATLNPLPVPRGSEWLGHAQAIWLRPSGGAGSDFRADGVAAWSGAGDGVR